MHLQDWCSHVRPGNALACLEERLWDKLQTFSANGCGNSFLLLSNQIMKESQSSFVKIQASVSLDNATRFFLPPEMTFLSCKCLLCTLAKKEKEILHTLLLPCIPERKNLVRDSLIMGSLWWLQEANAFSSVSRLLGWSIDSARVTFPCHPHTWTIHIDSLQILFWPTSTKWIMLNNGMWNGRLRFRHQFSPLSLPLSDLLGLWIELSLSQHRRHSSIDEKKFLILLRRLCIPLYKLCNFKENSPST